MCQLSTNNSELENMSEELTEIKKMYVLCSVQLVVKQTAFDELASAFKEHVNGCSAQLQLTNQNKEKVTAELQQQVDSSTSQIQEANERIRKLREEVKERTSSLAEQRHLKETEASLKYHILDLDLSMYFNAWALMYNIRRVSE